ncbi:ABC transporter substrate-binding protein [Paracraurococcus lichenis]|uniref:Extracellular solute-binding protein n=1 Tax=Paracraurococcus lichenis TaxID=3064888 RepID=A0ABT9E2B4_9PROT|nr:extracellular solute-binding protein [Paracraurococcus sp. LOR1-02]MDO9710279.1 extracellular solute-binding protein [Paracraurococcus sp. LOR1-02]
MQDVTRRTTLGLGAAVLATPALAQGGIPRSEGGALRAAPESGASLRVIRPARFVEPDETIFRANAQRFQERFNIPVRVDFVGWEDIRPQTAVVANTGTGPDIVIGWSDDPHIYAEKLVEMGDVAEYLGQRYGGWGALSEKYGRQHITGKWLGIPIGGNIGPCVWRQSAVKEAGFDSVPDDHEGFLKLCLAMKKNNKPVGFALGNAVGDGNGFAQWLLWSHNASLVDEEGKVSVNSRETVEALKYLQELYQAFVPGTLSWLDPSNNRAYSAQEIYLTFNGVSLYFTLKNDPKTAAIAEDTQHTLVPKGKAKSSPHTATVMNAMVFRHSRFPNAAKQFIAFMLESEQYDPWMQASLGYWAHPLRAYNASTVWTSDPKLTLFRETMESRYWSGYKGPISQASGAVAADYVLVQMCASVATGQATPEAAAREAERRARRYYRNA